MDLNVGKYKMTDVGLIPFDWEVKSLGDIGVCIIGLTYKPENVKPHGIHVLRASNINESGLVYNDNVFVDIAVAEKLILKEGDILICVRNGSRNLIGKCALIDDRIAGQTFGAFMSVFRTQLYPLVFHQFKSVIIQKQINENIGATINQITNKHLKSFKIPFPPNEDERILISTALNDIGSLIRNFEDLISKKLSIKYGAMQKLLAPKKSWVKRKLGEIVDIIMGQSPDSLHYNNKGHGIPLIQGNADIEKRKSIQRYWTTKITKKCEKGNLIMTVRAPVGLIGVASENSCIGRGVCSFKMKDVDQNFLYHTLVFKESDWKAIEQGSTFTSANSNQIFEFEIPLPKEKSEQQKIATILSDMDEDIEALEKKLLKFQMVKQGMMQNLLTGKIRLIKPDLIETKIHTIHDYEEIIKPKHNWEFNESVLISVLTQKFSTPEFPLGRKRYTKLSYLFHRYKEREAEGYLKKAAGPYNPKTKYGGVEKIALNKKYIMLQKNDKFSGFIAGENFNEALEYFIKWYGEDVLSWLEQFRMIKNDTLELWATVDMAIQEISKSGKEVSVKNVKKIIIEEEEWKDKLNKSFFSDENINSAINKSKALFG